MQMGDTMKSETATATAPAQRSADLVDRIRAGDGSAWCDLIKQYAPLLKWRAHRCGLSAEDAADAVQLTWLRCLEHFDQLTHPDRLGSWLTAICHRECVKLATRKAREMPITDLDASRLITERDGERDPCAEVARRDEHDRLHRAITALPDRQRTVLIELMTREGQSYLDLSRRLGLPVGSIGPTWQRAVTRLRHDPRLVDRSAKTSRRHLQEKQTDIADGRRTLVSL
jgi:RNA polymerase sigma factor (sigma-70 family)